MRVQLWLRLSGGRCSQNSSSKVWGRWSPEPRTREPTRQVPLWVWNELVHDHATLAPVPWDRQHEKVPPKNKNQAQAHGLVLKEALQD